MRIPEPQSYRPIKLLRQNERIGESIRSIEQQRAREHEQRRKGILNSLVSNQAMFRLDRKDARALRDIIVERPRELGDPHLQRAIAWAKSQPNLNWRDLWALWCATGDADLATKTGEQMLQKAFRLPKSRKFWPPWLQRPGLDPQRVLRQPLMELASYLISSDKELTSFSEWSGISTNSALGAEIAAGMVSKAPQEVWERSSPRSLREWAKDRPIEVLSAVLERQILDLAGHARSHADIPTTSERKDLSSFSQQSLGHPDESPHNWTHLSERAQERFRMLYLADEIAKIMARFAEDAEPERYEFWKKWTDAIQDACFINAQGTAVCAMVIQNILFIEFGSTGNAIYTYNSPDAPLRRLIPAQRRYRLSDFRVPSKKLQDRSNHNISIRLNDHLLEFKGRIPHHSGWKNRVIAMIPVARKGGV